MGGGVWFKGHTRAEIRDYIFQPRTDSKLYLLRSHDGKTRKKERDEAASVRMK